MKIKICEILLMVLGTYLIAFAVHECMIPGRIVSGGMNGVSVILNRLFNISPALTLFVSNIPLTIVSFIFLGKKYTLNTLACSFLLPFFIFLIQDVTLLHGGQVFNAIVGGIIMGLGIGLVFRGGGSTGGTAIIAQILHNHSKLTLGMSVLIIDGSVLLSSFLFFDIFTGIISMVSLILISLFVEASLRFVEKSPSI